MIALYIQAFQKYAVFSGRASRSEYWGFVLVHILIVVALRIANEIIDGSGASGVILWTGALITIAYALATLVPALAVSVRRLHDTGRSGWWFLINFIPLIGWLILIVFMCIGSEPRRNKYGIPHNLIGVIDP